MIAVFRAHGLRLGLALVLLLGVWAIGLVLAPAAALIDDALHTVHPASIEIATELDRLHDELAAARWDWEHTRDAEARAGHDRDVRRLAERAERLAALEREPRVVHGLAAFVRGLPAEARALPRTLGLAFLVAAVATILAYPIAWAATSAGRRGEVFLALAALPYLLPPVLRAAGWSSLAEAGVPRFVAADVLRFAALLHAGLIVALLPTVVALRRLDRRLVETARDLGAGTLLVHLRVILPEARPGLAVGIVLAFALSAGALATPWIATAGRDDDDLARLVWRAVFETGDWGLGAAHAVVLSAAVLIGAALLALLFGLSPSDLSARRRTR